MAARLALLAAVLSAHAGPTSSADAAKQVRLFDLCHSACSRIGPVPPNRSAASAPGSCSAFNQTVGKSGVKVPGLITQAPGGCCDKCQRQFKRYRSVEIARTPAAANGSEVRHKVKFSCENIEFCYSARDVPDKPAASGAYTRVELFYYSAVPPEEADGEHCFYRALPEAGASHGSLRIDHDAGAKNCYELFFGDDSVLVQLQWTTPLTEDEQSWAAADIFLTPVFLGPFIALFVFVSFLVVRFKLKLL